MLTANDLKNIDKILEIQERIVNQSKINKEIVSELRVKIAEELDNIQIKQLRSLSG